MYSTAAPNPVLAAFLVSLLFAETAGRAQTADRPRASNLHLGPVEIRGGIGGRVMYDDNVYLISEDQQLSEDFSKDDIIYSVIPAAGITYTNTRFNVVGDYRISFDRYSDNTEEDSEEQFLDFLADYESPRGLRLSLRDTFRDLAGPSESEVTRRADRTENTTDAEAIYQATYKSAFGANYRHYLIDFTDEEYTEYDEDVVGITGFRVVTPKKFLYLNANYGYLDIDDGSEGDYVEGNLGIRGQVTGKITGRAQVGYQDRSYDSTPEVERGGISDLVSLVDLQYRPQLPTAVIISALRSPYVSLVDVGNTYTLTRISLGVRHELPSNFDLLSSISQSWYEYDRGFPTLAADGSTITEDRTDSTQYVVLGIGYQPRRWLRLQLDYLFRANSSDMDWAEYDNNRVGLTVAYLW